MEPMLLSARETAKALGICEKTLWTLTKQGGIPCIRVGVRVLYDPQDLRSWIDRVKTPLKAG